ncbi:TLDc domain-containing protein [Entamoeba marina]
MKQEIDILKKWSNKKNYILLFDSDINGNGEGLLEKIVLHKNNLYFITIEDDDNVFGGYIFSKISHVNEKIYDPNSFVFSLLRKGIIKNSKYHIKGRYVDRSFILFDNNDMLYAFGNDIHISKLNTSLSYCKQRSYDYKKEINSLVDLSYPHALKLQRLLILQMI